MKPHMNNGLFNSNDAKDGQHLNTHQFLNGADPNANANSLIGGVNSRGHHKRPKSNLDGFFKSSKGGPINSNELP